MRQKNTTAKMRFNFRAESFFFLRYAILQTRYLSPNGYGPLVKCYLTANK